MEERIFNRLRYGFMAGCVIFGSGSSVMINMMLQKFPYYPLFQASLMFTGEFIASFLLLFNLCKNSKIKTNNSTFLRQDDIPKFFSINGKVAYCGLSLLDLIASWIENYCFSKMNPTDFLSLKMVSTYYIVFYKIYVLKRKTYKHQWLGFIVFTLGILLVVIDNIITSSEGEKTLYGIYIALMLLAEFFLALHIVLLEYLIWKNSSNTIEINSLKGFAGLLLCCLAYYPLITIFGESSSVGNIETPVQDIFSHYIYCPIVACLIIDLCLYNLALVHYIKLTEALSFNCIDSGRIVIVSIFFGFYSNGDDKESIIVQVIAGVFVFVGLSIYNEVLVLPVFGLEKSAKLSINENKVFKQKRAEHRTWIHKLDELVDFQNKTKELNNY